MGRYTADMKSKHYGDYIYCCIAKGKLMVDVAREARHKWIAMTEDERKVDLSFAVC